MLSLFTCRVHQLYLLCRRPRWNVLRAVGMNGFLSLVCVTLLHQPPGCIYCCQLAVWYSETHVSDV